MKYLVTGGEGYVGRYVALWLIEQGHDVVLTTRRGTTHVPGAEVINLDILNSDKSVFETVGRPDILIHLAWEDGFSHASDKHLKNLPGHINFIRNMLEGGLKHVVGLGTMHEVGYHIGPISENTATSPLHAYGIAKNHLRLVQELYCKEFSAVYQWLRCFYIYGEDELNNSIFAKLLQATDDGKKSFPLNSGELLYDFIHVKNLGAQIAAVSSQTEVVGVINCCSGEPVSLKTMVQRFVKDHALEIELDWGKFPLRAYDSRAIWGDRQKLDAALAAYEKTLPQN
ncbi:MULTISPECIES: NAD(P)-dependent oxidoreductase [unclassified Rhizobium]|uniref:NAD-dependent epimerase/dehydratase family protein n=1 Tax=unclassified Rhizobium TaxID=2613769 RepID=UPI002B25B38F|nr:MULTISPECIES: NAD(P)-dependent oxidoreductase [unclassified Rhizobium]